LQIWITASKEPSLIHKNCGDEEAQSTSEIKSSVFSYMFVYILVNFKVKIFFQDYIIAGL